MKIDKSELEKIIIENGEDVDDYNIYIDEGSGSISKKTNEEITDNKIIDLQYENAELLFNSAISNITINSIEQENAEILFNSAMQEFRITGLEEENASILFELAAIKGGI